MIIELAEEIQNLYIGKKFITIFDGPPNEEFYREKIKYADIRYNSYERKCQLSLLFENGKVLKVDIDRAIELE